MGRKWLCQRGRPIPRWRACKISGPSLPVVWSAYCLYCCAFLSRVIFPRASIVFLFSCRMNENHALTADTDARQTPAHFQNESLDENKWELKLVTLCHDMPRSPPPSLWQSGCRGHLTHCKTSSHWNLASDWPVCGCIHHLTRAQSLPCVIGWV